MAFFCAITRDWPWRLALRDYRFQIGFLFWRNSGPDVPMRRLSQSGIIASAQVCQLCRAVRWGKDFCVLRGTITARSVPFCLTTGPPSAASPFTIKASGLARIPPSVHRGEDPARLKPNRNLPPTMQGANASVPTISDIILELAGHPLHLE
jgi:hypothetical protein